MGTLPPVSNYLLSSLGEADFALLEADLEDVKLELRQRLEEPATAVSHAYFLQSGVASIVAHAPNEREAEIGLVGREGFTGFSTLLDDPISAFDVYVQIEGHALRIGIPALKAAANRSEGLRSLLLRFTRCFWIQTGFTALANGQANVEARLARWLLMAHDRIDGDTIHLTHEFMAVMLGVRRPGVTVAVQELEGEGLIRALRGVIIIRDRQGLIDRADGVYTLPEAEYERLMGMRFQRL